MATYFVANGGSNTAPYDTWAKAATSLQTALTAASGGTDTVVIQYNGVPTGDAEVGADTTYTTTNHVRIISASADDASTAYTPTVMGTANWIGNSTTSWAINLNGGADDKVYVYGLTLRIAGATSKTMTLSAADGGDMIADSCYLWLDNTHASSRINVPGSVNNCVTLTGSTLRFGHAGQLMARVGTGDLIECSVSSAGTAPTILFTASGQGLTKLICCDLSFVTGTLIANSGTFNQFEFVQCKFGAGVTVLAAQTSNPAKPSASACVFDCASGDTHYNFGYYNAFGSLTTDAAIYADDGAKFQISGTGGTSWKIVTTANATLTHPFVTPWMSVHHEGTSAITPNLEILRDGSATAYQNDEVWSEWMYKGTSGNPLGIVVDDKVALNGAAADQTTGALAAAGWTGENATSWFGKLNPTSAITPAEIGDLCARVCVGEPSITVYVDPTIRGRT